MATRELTAAVGSDAVAAVEQAGQLEAHGIDYIPEGSGTAAPRSCSRCGRRPTSAT